LLLWRERLNDDQQPAAARAGDCECAGLVIGAPGEIVIAMICIWRFGPEQFPDPGDTGGAVAISEEAVVADAVLTFWEHMNQEPADELSRSQRHGGVPTRALNTVILDAEGDMIGIGPD